MSEELGPVQAVAERLRVLYPDVESLRRLLALAQVDAGRIPFDGRSANARRVCAGPVVGGDLFRDGERCKD